MVYTVQKYKLKMKPKYLVMPRVWLLMLDNRSSELHPDAKKFRRIIEDDGEILITGMILHNVLHHINPEKRDKVSEFLDKFIYTEIEKKDYLAAAESTNPDMFLNVHQIIADKHKAKLFS